MLGKHRGSRTASALLIGLLAIVAFVGCGDDENPPTSPPPSGSTTFEGTIVGDGVSGALSVSVATSTLAPQFGARASVTAAGTLNVSGGGSVALTGTYDNTADALSLTGGGWTITGGLTNLGTSVGMEGTFSGPGGESGVFSVQANGTGADTVVVVVGTYSSLQGGPGGVFNISIRGAEVHGNAWEDGSLLAIPLDGTYASATGDISIVNPENPTGPPLAIGNFSSATGLATGTYDDGDGENGTWSGTRQ